MAIADLPEEILFDHIFCRLPIKSILCFRSVCKAWNRMLREQQFIKIHIKNQQQQAFNGKKKLVITTKQSNFPCYFAGAYYSIDCDEKAVKSRVAEPPPEVVVSRTEYHLLGSCKGLVAIIAFAHGAELILWNPSTRESKYLTHTQPTITFSDNLFGFVYDLVTDDYRIIRIITSTLEEYEEDTLEDSEADTLEECEVHIYSLRNNSWKKANVFPYNLNNSVIHSICTPLGGVELNGYLYWMVRPPNRGYDASPCIMGFGLRDETITFLGLPCDFRSPDYYKASYMGLKTMGRSCIAAYLFCMNDKLLVWTSKEPDIKENKWEKLITLSLSSPKHKFTCSIRPLWFTKDGKILLIIIRFSGGDKDQHQHDFGVYDPQKKSLEFVGNYGIKNTSHVKVTTEMEYIPSLVSPNMFESGIRQVMDSNMHQDLGTKMRQDIGTKKPQGHLL